MKTRLIISNLLLVTICVLVCSCSSKSEVNTDNIESHELYRIQVGGKCGFINELGKLVIEPQFDWAYWYFSDGVCYAENGERKGLINTDGEFILDLDNSIYRVRDFQNGVAVFLDNELKEGLIKESGEILIPASFQEIIMDDNNGFIVKDTLGRFGYVNHQGQLILPCQCGDILGINEGVMAVKMNDKYGYIDTTGAWVIDAIFDEARDFGNHLARVKVGKKWQFIDHDGVVADRFNYDDILTGFSCNRAFVRNGNAIELIDANGTRITVVEADSVYGFSEGYATFKKNGKFGKLDTIGNVVVQPVFEHLFRTTNGTSVFEKNGKQGLIDNAGNTIVDAVHEECWNNGKLLLCADDNWQRGTYYGREGNLIWKDMNNGYNLPEKPTKEDYIKFFDSRMADLDPIEGLYYVTYQAVREDRKTGYMTQEGKTETIWYAVTSVGDDEYGAFNVNELGYRWLKKFVRIRESNIYAITDIDTAHRYAEDYKLTLDNPSGFDILLRTSGNGSYNWYARYEFIKEFPSSEAFEHVQQAEWTGTGFAIADGYFATNYHVTNGAKTIKVRGVNGDMEKAYKAYVVASDRNHDLAIVRIIDKGFDSFDDIPYCIGKTMPEVGDDVFVLGYPMTNTMGQEVKLTDGIISAISGYKGNQSMYQISAAVQPGNSGGPLFDSEGNVIGIVCAKHADTENANYAIKVSYLFSLVNSSGLGIKMSDSNKVKSKSLSQKVKKVKPFVYLIECQSH